MTAHVSTTRLNSKVSRRQAMIGAASLSFAVAFGGRAGAAALASENAGKTLNPWVSIAPDGTISIMSAATEMGQGSMTSLPLILAEELDADWAKVRIVPAPTVDQINGSAQYAIDVQLPGMLYGAVVRAPVEGSAPENFDEAKVRAIAGVVKTVKLPYGVGVVAETPWAAFAARQALADSVTWTKSGKAWGFDSEQGLEIFAATARDPSQPGTDWFKAGDLRNALA